MLGEHDIDQELRAALSVTPSADFEARVLRRIEARAERRAGWWPSYAIAAAAAAVALVTAVVSMSRQDVAGPLPVARRASPEPVSSSSAPETRTPPASSAPANETPEFGSLAGAAQRAQPTHGRAAPPPAAEVIVPAEHVAALQRLVEGINNGTLDIPPAAPAEVPVVEPVDPDAPAVEALVVNPIPVPAADVHQSGPSPVMRGF